SLPMSRFNTTRPATVTTSSVWVSAARSGCSARTAPDHVGSATSSTSASVIANARRGPNRSRLSRRAASTSASRPVGRPVGSSGIDVLLVDEPEAFEGEPGLEAVDGTAVRDHDGSQAAGRDHRGAGRAEIHADALHDPVDLARGAVDQAGLYRLDGRAADRRP